MSGVFFLELDTTPPIIEVFAPKYTIPQIITEVRVESNEEILVLISDVVDALGIIHHYVFDVEDKEALGKFRLLEYPFGITQVLIRAVDSVGNISDIATASFLLGEGHNSKLKVQDATREIIANDELRRVHTDTPDATREIIANDELRRVHADTQERGFTMSNKVKSIKASMVNRRVGDGKC